MTALPEGARLNGVPPRSRFAPALFSVLSLFSLAGAAAEPASWWEADVWRDPDRPFLFYPDPEESREVRPAPSTAMAPEPAASPEPPAPPADPDDFSALQTVEDVRAEAKRRLERAVMAPSEENIRAWLAVNSFMLGKANQFSDAFSRMRIAYPQYDWTASHPTANHATAALDQSAEAGKDAFLAALAEEAGLVFAASGDAEADALAAGPVRALARSAGFELLAVSPDGREIEPIGKTRPDNGIVAKLGLERFPALVLLPKPGARLEALARLERTGKPLLIATGAVSTAELKKRLLLLLSPPIPLGNDAALPTRSGRALLSGEAFRAEGARRASPYKAGGRADSAESAESSAPAGAFPAFTLSETP